MLKSLLVLAMLLSLTGCAYLSDLYYKYTSQPLPEGAQRATLILYTDGVPVTYDCIVDPSMKALTNCTEVK